MDESSGSTTPNGNAESPAAIVNSRQTLTDQLGRVQSELDRLRVLIPDFDPSAPPGEVTADWVRGIIAARRRREKTFGDTRIFADPAWDILLELYAVELTDERATITDVCNVAAIPGTTGLRWVGQLETLGLVVRTTDPKDGRCVFLRLSSSAVASMNKFFRGATGAPPPV